MTVATRTLETKMLTVKVIAMDPEKPISEQPVALTDSGGKSSNIAFGNMDDKSGKPVAQVSICLSWIPRII
jgi:hypothetical protein